jgi:hypothetical protein
MKKSELFRRIEKLGWKVKQEDIDFRVQDSTLWFKNSAYDEPLITATKRGRDTLYIVVAGDIRINGKRDNTRFVFKGGNPLGEPTYYLRQHGNWENNNWFEVGTNEDLCNMGTDIAYTVDDAVQSLLQRMKEPLLINQK